METNGVPLTPDQARTALADTERVRASTAALSATPWQTWFVVVLTVYMAALPVLYGGVVAEPEWLLPHGVWAGLMFASLLVYSVLVGIAGRAWRKRTGVALRWDVLPKRATVPLFIGLPVLILGAAHAFRITGSVAWLAAGSVLGAAVSLGFHLAFFRLHRKSA